MLSFQLRPGVKVDIKRYQPEPKPMSALVIRNLPDDVHDSLRQLAARKHMSVEAIARQALADLVRAQRPAGIDFTALAQHRVALGFAEDGPAWDSAMDEPALSRRVLGLD